MRLLAPLENIDFLTTPLSEVPSLKDVFHRMQALENFEARIDVVGEFLLNPEADILALKGIGRRSVDKVNAALGADFLMGQWRKESLSDYVLEHYLKVEDGLTVARGDSVQERCGNLYGLIKGFYEADRTVLAAGDKPVKTIGTGREFYL